MGLNDPENNSPEDHARRVREMFAQISPRYDLLNHLLSANIDGRWRRAVIRKLRPLLPANAQLLDVACGTGDLSIALFEKTGAQVIGLDFCRPMLELAARKAPQLRFVEGDALQLPFAEASFDAVTIGFGLRNLSSVERGLGELRRVLKPQGWAAILEFSRPVVPGMRALAAIYCMHLLPRIGGLVSGSRSAYEYLPESISRFPDQQKLAAIMRDAGFCNVAFQNLTGGVAALHIGQRPVLD
ncbi:MAG TPA: bifunctional demethylmenaquinone methyltransferase/2-methoxy-6-polyprenyl-1,4-benzoquinol methylase UbiE [Pyrinomonadaceae bacterium]|nr:bifunctional demethylmenaquinone methyltransferase/2-methoxy-6-polyprenyl-1,4-benzoquinol methylase UbiE [Pyrinomonadaceae bacterium]